MKKLYPLLASFKFIHFPLTIIAIIMTGSAVAQGVAINADGSSPDNSAILDVKSDSSGFLSPRLSLGNNGIFTGGPAPHLFVTNLNNAFNAGSRFNSGIGYYRNAGTKALPNWRRLLESADSNLFWSTRGNASTAGDFIGTTNSQDLPFRVDGTLRLKIPALTSDYAEFSNNAGVSVTAFANNAVYSIDSDYDFGLSGKSLGSNKFMALRFGANAAIRAVGGLGVAISVLTDAPIPTEELDVFGNSAARGKFIYSESHINTPQTKTGNVLRYWSGTFLGKPIPKVSSTSIFEEASSNDHIRFRLTKLDSLYTLDASIYETSNTKYVSNSNVYNLPLGGWGGWLAISNPFYGTTGSKYEFFVAREATSGGNDLKPFYKITIFFNGGHEYVKVIVDAYYSKN